MVRSEAAGETSASWQRAERSICGKRVWEPQQNSAGGEQGKWVMKQRGWRWCPPGLRWPPRGACPLATGTPGLGGGLWLGPSGEGAPSIQDGLPSFCQWVISRPFQRPAGAEDWVMGPPPVAASPQQPEDGGGGAWVRMLTDAKGHLGVGVGLCGAGQEREGTRVSFVQGR